MKKLFLIPLILTTLFSVSERANAVEPYLGEIRYFGFNFCPRGWMAADGQLLQVSQNTALFSLYGTLYGGDGRTTFAVPDLRGRFIMGEGNGPDLTPKRLGQRGGVESVTLTQIQMPAHQHSVSTEGNGSEGAVQKSATGKPADTVMTSEAGASRPHTNMPPFTVLTPCVAFIGTYPSRS